MIVRSIIRREGAFRIIVYISRVARRTARMPLRKMPSKVSAPPIEVTGAEGRYRCRESVFPAGK